MKILLGLASADGGSATIGGLPYRRLDRPLATVGALIEPDAFHPSRSGRSHLRIVADSAGVEGGRVDELLEFVDLEDAAGRHVGGYSMGMRQRLGLAVALLGDPDVLVLDEPSNGLDPQGIRWLRDLLKARAKTGGTVFVSSHLLAEMELLADEIVVINRGRLVTTGPIEKLRDAAMSVRTPSPDQLASALRSSGGSVQILDPDHLLVRGLSMSQIGDGAFEAGVRLHELAPHSGSLESLFLDLTDDETGDSEGRLSS
jgi:ABC-2 type transport system ATP-binding protein